ncbi:MAG: Lrp/AsnC ligand binding domain-containing protein, partial [Nitrosopumilaceae archaeon]
YLTFGAYDVIAEVHANSQAHFEKTVSSKIRKLARVVSTMTLSVINPE